VERARTVLEGASDDVRRVGVYGARDAAEIGEEARELGLTTIQLHGDPDASALDDMRRHFAGEIWIVLRLVGDVLPRESAPLFDAADAVVLDSFVPGQLGGTGTTLPWESLANAVAARRGRAKLIVAGGLRPNNVREAIDALRPDVVDVSSGVESAPGIKDHEKMRAFRDAVFGNEVSV
jgi:phosphoribosylanthranilate isomerase